MRIYKFETFEVPQSELDSDTVKTILSEYKIHNADITLKYDATSDDLIDVVEGNRIYVPCIYLLNKIGKNKCCFFFKIKNWVRHFCLLDQISIEELDVIYKIPHCVPISAHHKWNFDDVLEKMWEYLKLVRMWVPENAPLQHATKTFSYSFQIHETQRPAARLQLPDCLALGTHNSGRFLQQATQDHRQGV